MNHEKRFAWRRNCGGGGGDDDDDAWHIKPFLQSPALYDLFAKCFSKNTQASVLLIAMKKLKNIHGRLAQAVRFVSAEKINCSWKAGRRVLTSDIEGYFRRIGAGNENGGSRYHDETQAVLVCKANKVCQSPDEASDAWNNAKQTQHSIEGE